MGYSVVFYCPDRHLAYDGRTPDEAGVGGGVTARVRLAAALARQGHDVTLIANCGERATFDGVEYLPLGHESPARADVLVLNTTGGALDLTPALELRTEARLRVLWCGGKPRPAGVDIVPFDYFYAVSNFLRREISKTWGPLPGRPFVAYNGIPEELFSQAEHSGRERDPYRLVFLGHPSKGIETALDVLRRLCRLDARYTLHVFGGARLWGQDEAPPPQEAGLVHHGLVGQRRLAEELLGAGFALHLQSVEDAFGISLAESLRAGCLALASPVGAFPELIRNGWNGFLLPGDPTGDDVRSWAVDVITSLQRQPNIAARLRENASRSLTSWDVMASAWAGHWDWHFSGAGRAAGVCTECGSDMLGLADGNHCLRCGRYDRLPSWGGESVLPRDGPFAEWRRPTPAESRSQSCGDGSRRTLGAVRRLLPPWVKVPLRRAYHLVQRARYGDAFQAAWDEVRGFAARHAEARETLIFLPGLRWEGQLFQRPQQLARALAAQGALVFYLEEPEGPPQVRELEPRLVRCSLPVEHLPDLAQAIVYVLTWNRSYLRAFRRQRMIYDFVDSLEVFPGLDRAALVREHLALLRRATLVLATSRALHRQALEVRADAVLCPNAVDYDHFVQARDPAAKEPPEDLTPILGLGRPVIGYYGALAEWFDYDLLGSVAGSRPDLSFVLIGPDHDGSFRRSGLADHPNVWWLGQKPYGRLPDYLRWFDVATIPFRLSPITHATSPLKLFEYMAGGKPVVITPMEESRGYDGVLIATEAQDFSRRLSEALTLRGDSAYLRRVDQVARENAWRARAETILARLEQLRATPG